MIALIITALKVLVGLWALAEVTAQLAHLEIFKVWSIPWDIPSRCGIALHPLLIITDGDHCIVHEKQHARQQANYTWLLWFVLYIVSGKFRVRQEAEADIVSLVDKFPDPSVLRNLNSWLRSNARALVDSTYFPELPGIFYMRPLKWLVGQNPGEEYAYEVQKEYLTKYAVDSFA